MIFESTLRFVFIRHNENEENYVKSPSYGLRLEFVSMFLL